MGLQEMIDGEMLKRRREVLETSDQLTLGEMILKSEPLISKQKEIKKKHDHEEAKVVFDFEYLFPTGIDSWRGSYKELALGFDNSNNMEVENFK